MTETSYLGLKKPDPQDYYDVGDWNDNSDTLDQFAEGLAGDGGVLQQMQSAIAALAGGVHLKGAVNYYTDLPATGQSEGDAYTVLYAGTSGTEPLGVEYAWATYDGTPQWIPLGVDPTYYAKAADLATETAARQKTDAALIDVINRGPKNLLPNTLANGAQSRNVTASVAADGTFTLSGTAASSSPDAVFVLCSATPVKAGTYHCSGCPAGGSTATYRLDFVPGSGSAVRDTGSGATLTLAADTTVYAQAVVYRGKTAPAGKWQPMLCADAVHKLTPDYVPHAPTNAELYAMIQAQT